MHKTMILAVFCMGVTLFTHMEGRTQIEGV
jgi:hypothetical protein